MRDSAIIYRSFYEAIKSLPDEKDQVALWNAVCELCFNRKVVKLKGVAATVFTLIRPNLEANLKRYDNGNKQKGSKPEAKGKQTRSKPEGNKDKDKDVDKDKALNKDKDGRVKIPRPVKTLFRESQFFDKKEFSAALSKDERYASAHFDYYHEVINNWSDQGNRKIDWLATSKNWILRDLKDGKFVDKNFNPNKSKYESKAEQAYKHGIDQLERIKAGKL